VMKEWVDSMYAPNNILYKSPYSLSQILAYVTR